MNLAPGDIAVIDNFEYPISYINEDGIYIVNRDNSLSLLVYKPNKWIVKNSPHPHRIQFMKKEIHIPTIEDMQIKIMLYLDDQDLINLCQENLNSICNNENFWTLRIKQEFGPLTAKYKPADETYKEQYWNVLNCANEVIKEPRKYKITFKRLRLDCILALVKKLDKSIYRREYIRIIEILMDINDVEIWNYIKPSIIHLVKERIFHHFKRTDVLHWLLLTQEKPSKKLLQRISSSAMMLGDLNIVEDLYQKKIIPEPYSIAGAAMHNSIETLKWAIEKGLITDDVINVIIKRAGEKQLESLKLLYSYGLINIQVLKEKEERQRYMKYYQG